MKTCILLAIFLLVVSALLLVPPVESSMRRAVEGSTKIIRIHYQIVNFAILEDGGFNEQIRVSAKATSLASHAQARANAHLL